MKDAEFLELLNLYLDHEISAADAARLEAEVQSNPARRRTYLEYCRMQKACTLLAKDFVSEAPAQKIVAFEPRRAAWSGAAFGLGGLAVAAACVALVLVNRTPNAANSAAPSDSVVVATPAPVPAVTTEKIPMSAVAQTVTVPARPAFASLVAPTPQVERSDEHPLVADFQQMARAAQFDWMKSVQLVPMQSLQESDLRLDGRSPLQAGNRTFTKNRPIQGEVQMSAFRFQK